MPTLNPHRTPERLSYDQQVAREAAAQAAGLPPSLPTDLAADPVGGFTTGTALVPLPYRVGIYDRPDLCRPRETLLVFRESEAFFAGRAFELRDSDGAVVVRVDPRHFSIHDAKDIEAADGTKLFTVKTKLVSVRKAFEVAGPDGTLLFEVKHGPGRSGPAATFSNMSMAAADKGAGDGGRSASTEMTITVRGSFHGGSGDLLVRHADDGAEDEKVIAQVRHSVVEVDRLVQDTDTYWVRVAAGVDLALVGTICLCFDQLRESKDK